MEPENDECGVVEIGPGMCDLTKLFLETHKNPLTAIEIDSRALEYLEPLKLQYPNFDFKIADACKQDYTDASLVFGNLPYNVGTKILLRCCRQKVKKMVFLLQAEVVDRICAKVNTEHYGSLSILMQLYYKVRHVLKIPPEAFTPRPKVQSKLLVCDLVGNDVDFEGLSHVLRESFKNPRKMLGNNIENLPKDIDPKRRPGNLTIEEYVGICRHQMLT